MQFSEVSRRRELKLQFIRYPSIGHPPHPDTYRAEYFNGTHPDRHLNTTHSLQSRYVLEFLVKHSTKGTNPLINVLG